MNVSLTEIVNKEKLLNFALEILNERDHDVAESIVIWYIINESKEKLTEEEIAEKYEQLLVGYALESLYKKGLVDIYFDKSGEIVYNISNEGNELAKKKNL